MVSVGRLSVLGATRVMELVLKSVDISVRSPRIVRTVQTTYQANLTRPGYTPWIFHDGYENNIGRTVLGQPWPRV